MRIILSQNPLAARVELDDADRARLRYELKIEALEEAIIGASLHLSEGSQFFDIHRAREDLGYASNDQGELDRRVQELAEHYEQQLLGRHVGDCTSVACSCSKCHAEGLLGIDTLGKLSKGAGHCLMGEYARGASGKIEELEASLAKGFERTEFNAPHIPRWTASKEEAIAYMKAHAQRLRELGAEAQSGAH